MGISLRQSDNLDRLPPERVEAGRIAPWHKPRDTWDVVIARAVGACGLTGFAALLTWLAAPAALPYVVLGGIGLAGAAWAKDHIVFERVRGVPVSAARLARVAPDAALAPDSLLAGLLGVDQTYAGAVVPAQQTYSPTFHNSVETTQAQGQPSALPEPGLQLVPDAEWRRWIGRAPHLLVAGRTDAGKTTLMEAILNERAAAGDDILILDPHYQPGKWCGLPAVGGGNSFDAILDMLPRVLADMDARYQEFERGKPTEDFQRLTILIDEAPALVDYCMDLTPSGRPRINDMRWPRFAKRLGSEARKVRISVILGSQSTLVTDLLINSQMRENYLRIGLGDRARPLIHEEANPKRRAQLDELLRGQAHPAAMEWRGDFHLLDTSGVPDLATRRVPMAALWTPPEPVAGVARPVVASVRPSAVASAVMRPPSAPASVSGQTDRRTVTAAQKMALIRAMRRGGRTREEARGILARMGEGLDNDDWAAARP